MNTHRFRQTTIPTDLAKEVVQVIQEHPHLGYGTLSEFIRVATMLHLRSVQAYLGLRMLWHTAAMGSRAVDAILRDSLPPEYQALLGRDPPRL